jgi:hypothetical protein
MTNLHNSTEEIWKDVPGFEGFYQASTLGRIRSLDRESNHPSGVRFIKKGKVLKLWLTRAGYYSAHLQVTGKNISRLAHVIVARTFIPGYFEGATINHINCIKTDNRPENLEWCTRSQNVMALWKLADERTIPSEVEERIQNRPVLHKPSGKVYRSVYAAAKGCGYSSGTLWRVLTKCKKQKASKRATEILASQYCFSDEIDNNADIGSMQNKVQSNEIRVGNWIRKDSL